MKKYTYTQARQNLAEVLDTAVKEEVLITRRDGGTFSLTYHQCPLSPFDVPGIKTKATTRNILDAVKESRHRSV